MGCPKPFSCDFGMGAALLEKPNRAKDILRALVKNVSLPITCKIRFVPTTSFLLSFLSIHPVHIELKNVSCRLLNRILPNIEDSVKMVREFESIGVSAIAVHGRLKEQQSEGTVNRGVYVWCDTTSV